MRCSGSFRDNSGSIRGRFQRASDMSSRRAKSKRKCRSRPCGRAVNRLSIASSRAAQGAKTTNPACPRSGGSHGCAGSRGPAAAAAGCAGRCPRPASLSRGSAARRRAAPARARATPGERAASRPRPGPTSPGGRTATRNRGIADRRTGRPRACPSGLDAVPADGTGKQLRRMAATTDAKRSAAGGSDAAIGRIRELNDRVLENASRGGAASAPTRQPRCAMRPRPAASRAPLRGRLPWIGSHAPEGLPVVLSKHDMSTAVRRSRSVARHGTAALEVQRLHESALSEAQVALHLASCTGADAIGSRCSSVRCRAGALRTGSRSQEAVAFRAVHPGGPCTRG
jgi:hypothetical protein